MSFILELIGFLNKENFSFFQFYVMAIFGSLLIIAQGSLLLRLYIQFSKLDDNISISSYYHDSALV